MSDLELDVIRVNLFETQPLGRGRSARLSVLSGPQTGEYEVKLEGADRRYLYVGTPMCGKRVIKPAAGTAVSVFVTGPGGKCAFDSVVAEIEDQDPSCISILLPAEAQRMQRRRHMRMAINLPVRVAKLPSGREPAREELRFAKARTTDIADGGLSFVCNALDCVPGDLLALVIDLPPSRRLVATAEVLRISDDLGGVAVQFSDIDEQAQNEIGMFIRQKRREARQATRGSASRRTGGQGQ